VPTKAKKVPTPKKVALAVKVMKETAKKALRPKLPAAVPTIKALS
jgi:hypothetical protein